MYITTDVYLIDNVETEFISLVINLGRLNGTSVNDEMEMQKVCFCIGGDESNCENKHCHCSKCHLDIEMCH